ncbi:COG0816 Predicted endonuclease involved in recombination (possible Holliday junction resolvase in Mycoplasmas and B. subtilis) [Rhabdaerophilaceae bacterium]
MFVPQFITLEDLVPRLGRNNRLMALDLGTKTIGLAVTDAERHMASPLKTLARGKFGVNAAELLRLAERYQVACFVLGMPLNMDGSSGPRAQATRAFARNLGSLTTIPILFHDERLSTFAAEDSMRAGGLSVKKRAATIDAAAAAIILDDCLRALRART